MNRDKYIFLINICGTDLRPINWVTSALTSHLWLAHGNTPWIYSRDFSRSANIDKGNATYSHHMVELINIYSVEYIINSNSLP
ncbi:MAG: hypothetical protein JW776_15520 [Candidatus Lokiarchaeota archaeon]|nr:hypothetical protein [Candidatus Lokiarchaeota archaeon]